MRHGSQKPEEHDVLSIACLIHHPSVDGWCLWRPPRLAQSRPDCKVRERILCKRARAELADMGALIQAAAAAGMRPCTPGKGGRDPTKTMWSVVGLIVLVARPTSSNEKYSRRFALSPIGSGCSTWPMSLPRVIGSWRYFLASSSRSLTGAGIRPQRGLLDIGSVGFGGSRTQGMP